MAMKTIRVTEEIHTKLSHLGLKSETYNDIIERLIKVYESVNFEEFSDKEAAYYNERIKHFENGNYEGTRKVDLEAERRNITFDGLKDALDYSKRLDKNEK